jgi:hypothetical protein
MAPEEAEIVRWHMFFKERVHVLSDGTRRGRNRELAPVLQRASSRTAWWHAKRPKSWVSTCLSKSEFTYSLMAREEAQIVSWHLSFKERVHVHTDGTRRGRNREVAPVLQRASSRTGWWHPKRPKSWVGTCPSKSEFTYSLMAHEEAEIVRWHVSFKERVHVQSDGTWRGPKSWVGTRPSKWEFTYRLMAHKEAQIVRWHLSFKVRVHVQADGTRRGPNREVAPFLQSESSRTFWWHPKRPKLWGGTCPSKWEFTYNLMAHEEAQIVRWHLSFKERIHVHTDGTRRGPNREVAPVLPRASLHTYWWHKKRPKWWGGTCPSKSEFTYILMAPEEAGIVSWHLFFKERVHVQSDGTRRGRDHELAPVLQRASSRTY